MSARRKKVREILEREGLGGLAKHYGRGETFRAYPCPCQSDTCSSWIVDGPGLSLMQGAIGDEATARLIEAAPKMFDLLVAVVNNCDEAAIMDAEDLVEQLRKDGVE